tara:strand:+ start:3188 stop:5932 length:2745 start_codon:yes stop_codon:yes gene_type:complete
MTTNATTTTKSNNKKTKKKKKMSKIIETKTNENDEKKGKKSDDAMEEEEENDDVNDDFNNTNINNEKTFTTIPEHIKTLALNQKENLARLLIVSICNRKDLFVKKSTLQTFDGEDFQLLRNVRELYLNENDIERVVNLDRLPKSLKLLHIEGNKLNSFEGIRDLPNTLQTLSTRNNSIRDFSEVARKDGRKWDLEYLDVRENEFGTFADLRLVEEFVHLRELRLRSEENDKSEKNDKKSNKKNNPVCKLPSYRMAVHAFIPWLEMLDDIGFTASSALVIEEEKKIFERKRISSQEASEHQRHQHVEEIIEDDEKDEDEMVGEEEEEEEEEETTSTLLSLEDDEEDKEKKKTAAQKWNASVKIDEQQQQQVQPSSRPLSKPSPSSSSKLMNHILRNKLSVSSSIAKRKDESMQTTTTNNNNNNDSNSSNNYRSSSSNSNTLTSKLERELYELKKTFETKRRENETLSGALMEFTNEVKQIDHETSEMYEKSAKLAELSNLNYASANRYKNEVDLLKRELKENRKTLENALSGEAEALEEVNTLKSTIESIRNEYNRTISRMRDEHKMEIRKVSKTVSSLEELEYAAEDEIEHLQGRIREMDKDYSKKLEDVTNERNAITRRLEVSFEELKELDSVLATETEARVTAESFAEELSMTNESLKNEMKEMREELMRLRKEVPELESKKEELSDECGSLKEELKAKEAAIAAQLEKVKKADTQLAEASLKEESAKKANLEVAHMRESLDLKSAMLENSNALVTSLKEEVIKLSKENKEYAIEHAKCSTTLESQDARVIQLENELKSERSKRMAFERAHVGSKDEIIARDEMLHWANGEVERYGILLEEVKEEKEEIIDIARNLQEQCDDYKRIAERAFKEKENVEEEMRMLLSSQIRREEEFDMVRQVFAKSSLMSGGS